MVAHINYETYDGHRHLIKVVANTPLHEWFKDSLEDETMEIMVNSYHHQGVEAGTAICSNSICSRWFG